MWLLKRGGKNVSTMWLMKRGEECAGNQMVLGKGWGKFFSDPMFRTKGDCRFFLLFPSFLSPPPLVAKKGSSVLGLKGEEVKPDFTQSTSIFMIKVMRLFFYVKGFLDDAGTLGPGMAMTSVLLKFLATYLWSCSLV
jgi:hypothetical protein